MKAKLLVLILVICCITGIETYAISKGINGKCLLLAIGSLAGLGGYHFQGILDWVRKK